MYTGANAAELKSNQESSSSATLVLSNGMRFSGESIGAQASIEGELIFTTGMVGYTQSLTDPSYFGQILMFTYPLIGNYGVAHAQLDSEWFGQSGFESDRIRASGVIVATDSARAYHWQSQRTLGDWLKKESVPGIAGLDTRYLTQLIRSTPGLRARIVGGATSGSDEQFKAPGETSLSSVSTPTRRVIGKGSKRIALVDCGVKWNIVRQLIDLECEVELLPWSTDLSTVDCSGWLLSNGPGDPQNAGGLIDQVKKIMTADRPIFGICLGYQILALAAGAKTEKLKFGHRGHNHSVHLVGTNQGFMTSQNHGYCVIEETLPEGWSPWFKHLNDGTLEGIRHQSLPHRGVQFHPEAAAGPQDTRWLLENFIQEIRS